MKIVAISDTHNKHKFVQVPKCDLLIHCGDYSLHGSIDELNDFNKWFEAQEATHKILVPGNHDFICEELPALAKKTLTAGHLLVDEMVEINGLKIYGAPWVPQYGRWAYMLPRNEIGKMWEKIPEGLDILITHGPPEKILDRTQGGAYAGCGALRKTLETKMPKKHFFGHIHEGYGMVENYIGDKSTEHYNVAICTVHYLPINKPVTLYV